MPYFLPAVMTVKGEQLDRIVTVSGRACGLEEEKKNNSSGNCEIQWKVISAGRPPDDDDDDNDDDDDIQ